MAFTVRRFHMLVMLLFGNMRKFFVSTQNSSSASERELVAHLFSNYDKRIRPVKNWSTTLEVTIQPMIYSVVDVDELKEMLTLLLWIPQSWHDEYLTWDIRQWNGIYRINIPADQIWIPDGTIFNTLDSTESIPLSSLFARVQSDGYVEVDFNKLVNVRCPMDIRLFPFDTQSCNLQFGSWGFQTHQLRYKVKKTSIPDNNETSEWQIISFDGKKIFTEYESSDGESVNRYEEVWYTLVLKRKPLFYVLVILVPTYLIITICIIGLFIAHSADGEREERVSFGITTLLTMAVVLDMVSGQMPKSSVGLPLLGSYVLTETIISVVAMLVSVVIMFFNERVLRYNIPPPDWVWRIADKPHRRHQKQTDGSKSPLLGSIIWNQASDADELLTKLERLTSFIDDIEQSDFDKTLWHRFFAYVDLLSMIAFLTANTAITFIFFNGTLF